MSLKATPINYRTPFNAGTRSRVGLKQQSTQIGNIFNPRDYGLEPVKQDTMRRHNTFRGMIEILNARSCRSLADYLESLKGGGIAGNDRFGTRGLRLITQLSLNDPRWNQTQEPVLAQHRQMVKDMASRALDPQYKDLLNQVHHGNKIFEPGDMGQWLKNNPRKGDDANERQLYADFRKAMATLVKREGRVMMDFLESYDGRGKRGNYRFGLLGMYRLSKLRINSPEWRDEKIDNQELRYELIHAAKTAMASSNAMRLFTVHNGDGIFEISDIQNWLDANPL